MSDKFSVWSEYHGSADDSVQGLGSDGGETDIGSMAVKRGVVHTGDCNYCGRQCKIVTPWPEVACFYLGQMMPAMEGRIRYVREGVMTVILCGCGKAARMIIDWDEVSSWVDRGVRSGSLSPKIYEARRPR